MKTVTLVVLATMGASLVYSQATGGDRNFLKAASEENMAQIELGQLAGEKSSNSAVKQFATRMVSDHTKLEDKVKSVAAQWGVVLPASSDDASRAALRDLSAKSGRDFDVAYLTLMVKDLQSGVANFHQEAKGGDNPVFVDLAGQMTPTIETHLRLARDTAKQVGVPAAGSGQ